MASRQEGRVGFGEGDHAAHLVLELADVAGPAIEEQALHRFFGDAQLAFLEFLGGAGDEVVDEAGDLVAAFAQRRDRQADDVEAVEEVLAEAAVADGVFEIGVGGGDDADVDGSEPGSPSGAISPDSRKRRSFGWRSRPSSPISSRKRVPSRAARIRPS